MESFIGPGALFQGVCRANGGVHVQGTVEGEIESIKVVYVEQGGRVAANITAPTIIVAGEVEGELRSEGRVEITPSGRVTGAIDARILVMLEGAFFEGRITMARTSANDPTSPQ